MFNYGTTGHKFSDDLKYQNWTLHYSRNSNEISGWSNSTKFFWGTTYTIDVMYHILGVKVQKMNPRGNHAQSTMV